ncbi:MAG: hypothetical protein GC204_06875 [Chloroflexi bacterium]|nr:hypothetical protein [Chloroflexota bacterium]
MSELSFRYGRVWFGDEPEQASFIPTGFKEERIDQPAFISELSRSICLRLFLPGLGDSSGVLGAQFTSMPPPETFIRVGYNQSESPELLIDGLTESLADTILTQAVKQLTLKNALGSGLLFFNQARYHQMYSTPFVFRILTNSLILLLSSEIPESGDDMTTIVNTIIEAETRKDTRI